MRSSVCFNFNVFINVMKSIPNYLPHFLDLTSEVYLHSDNSFFEKCLFAGLSRKQKQFFAKAIGVSERIIYSYSSGKKKCPLTKMFKIAKLRKINNFLDLSYENFSAMSTQGHFPSKLPKKYSYELAYLTGFIAGDGHVSKRSEIFMYNDSKVIIQNIVPRFFKNVFNAGLSFQKTGNCYIGVVNSKPIHCFFNRVIGLPRGKKKGVLRVPNFIFLSDEFKVGFLQGLFDSDGGVTLSKKGAISILYSSSTKPFILQVKQLLHYFSVEIGGPYKSGAGKGLELRTYSKSQIKRFIDAINCYHPKKLNRLMPL